MKPFYSFLIVATILAVGMRAASAQVADSELQRTALAPSWIRQPLRDQLSRRAAELRAARASLGTDAAQASEPSIASGKVLTPSIDVTVAPGVPTILLRLRAGTVGIEYLVVEAISPSGNHNAVVSYYPMPYPPPPAVQPLRLTLTSPFTNGAFGLYAEPGAWTVGNITLLSRDGYFIGYGGSIFPSPIINVANSGTPDTTPPVVNHGDILTPRISVSGTSPYFAATLGVTDDLSGVVTASVSVAIPGSSGSSIYPSSSLGAPVTKGKVTIAASIPVNTPTGTYAITAISACDAAENCFYDTQAADIAQIFGTTTFKVTQ